MARVLVEYYVPIRAVHVGSVILSGTLFALRGLFVLATRTALAQRPLLRYLSYSIDTVLLVSAVLLVAILPWAMFSNGWLLVKLVLVAVYVLLGTFALKRGQTARTRGICYVAALATFVFVVGIAIVHQPLGWLYLLK